MTGARYVFDKDLLDEEQLSRLFSQPLRYERPSMKMDEDVGRVDPTGQPDLSKPAYDGVLPPTNVGGSTVIYTLLDENAAPDYDILSRFRIRRGADARIMKMSIYQCSNQHCRTTIGAKDGIRYPTLRRCLSFMNEKVPQAFTCDVCRWGMSIPQDGIVAQRRGLIIVGAPYPVVLDSDDVPSPGMPTTMEMRQRARRAAVEEGMDDVDPDKEAKDRIKAQTGGRR